MTHSANTDSFVMVKTKKLKESQVGWHEKVYRLYFKKSFDCPCANCAATFGIECPSCVYDKDIDEKEKQHEFKMFLFWFCVADTVVLAMMQLRRSIWLSRIAVNLWIHSNKCKQFQCCSVYFGSSQSNYVSASIF